MNILFGWHRPTLRCIVGCSIYRAAFALERLADWVDPPARHFTPEQALAERYAESVEWLRDHNNTTER